MEVSGQLHAPAALPSEKQPLVPIGKEDTYKILLEPFKERNHLIGADIHDRTIL
jgi:hypothetical protein